MHGAESSNLRLDAKAVGCGLWATAWSVADGEPCQQQPFQGPTSLGDLQLVSSPQTLSHNAL